MKTVLENTSSGLLNVPYSKQTSNIGDDVIVYSIVENARRLGIPIGSEMTSREELEKLPENGKNIVVGWLSFNKQNAIPPNIKQENILLYGIHFNNEEFCLPLIESIKKNDIEVGCRDTFTHEICQKHKIRSYMSYCPTLLFQQCYNPEQYCTFVDVFDEDMMNHVKTSIKLGVKFITHRNYFNPLSTFEERMQNIKRHLQLYFNSRFVVTTKMHCALPCISMGVPCFFYKHDTGLDSCRLSDYYPFLNTFNSIDEFKKIDLLNTKNPDISTLTEHKDKLMGFICHS